MTPRARLEHRDSAPGADRWLGQLLNQPFGEGLKPDDPVVDVGPHPNGPFVPAAGHPVDVSACSGLTAPERAQVDLHVQALTFMQRCWLTSALNALPCRDWC